MKGALLALLLCLSLFYSTSYAASSLMEQRFTSRCTGSPDQESSIGVINQCELAAGNSSVMLYWNSSVIYQCRYEDNNCTQVRSDCSIYSTNRCSPITEGNSTVYVVYLVSSTPTPPPGSATSPASSLFALSSSPLSLLAYVALMLLGLAVSA